MKKVAVVTLGALLTLTSLVAADFSKKSNAELQNLAGSVAPEAMLDYKAEVHKRIQSMSVGEAREFWRTMQENREAKLSQLSPEERRKHHQERREAMQKQLDKMSVKEAQEKGLWGHFGFYDHKEKHRGDRHGNRGECNKSCAPSQGGCSKR